MDRSVFKGKKVLVVDDQESFLEAVAFEFELLESKALKAKDGKEAFEIFKENRDIDLIVSDLRMPVWDGKVFLQEVRKISSPNPPFAFMTGFSDLKLYDALDMGADTFLGKPLDPDTFPDIVGKLLLPIEKRWLSSEIRKSKGYAGGLLPSIDDGSQFQLGRGGFFIASQFVKDFSSLEKGSFLDFNLAFKTGPVSKLAGKGYIAWVRHDLADGHLQIGCGIQFEALSEECNPPLVDHIKSKTFLSSVPKGASTLKLAG